MRQGNATGAPGDCSAAPTCVHRSTLLRGTLCATHSACSLHPQTAVPGKRSEQHAISASGCPPFIAWEGCRYGWAAVAALIG